MDEYIQTWEKGQDSMTMWYNHSIGRYEIEGIVGGQRRVFRFTNIYEANDYMERNGWK